MAFDFDSAFDLVRYLFSELFLVIFWETVGSGFNNRLDGFI